MLKPGDINARSLALTRRRTATPSKLGSLTKAVKRELHKKATAAKLAGP